MEKIRMTVVTDLGDVYPSQWVEYTDEEVLDLRRAISDFTKLNSLNLTTEDGALTYINPRHVVSVSIERY